MTDKFYGGGYVEKDEDQKEKLSPEDQAVYENIARNYIHNLHPTNFDRVRQFMVAMGQGAPDKPTMAPEEVAQLRFRLIDEELTEFHEAQQNDDIIGIADAIADLLYVVYGAAIAYGIDADACFAEVHRSNMSKLGEDGKPIYREDGKVMKGPSYSPPNLTPILFPTLEQKDVK